jgi:hypothetical protein
MLDAKSARERSMTADEELSDKQLEYIEREIINACNHSRRSVDLKGMFQSTTVKRLRDMGYTVNLFDDQKEGKTWTAISW